MIWALLLQYISMNELSLVQACRNQFVSFLLFTVSSSGLVMLKCFSVVYRLRHFIRFEQRFALPRIFHLMVKCCCLLLSCQMCLLSSVSFSRARLVVERHLIVSKPGFKFYLAAMFIPCLINSFGILKIQVVLTCCILLYWFIYFSPCGPQTLNT